jgi:hypothetical protein
MRILHLDTGRRIQGGQIQVRLLMAALRQAGVECGIRSPWLREPVHNPDLSHAHDARSHTWARRPLVVARRVGFPVGRGWISRWKYARPDRYIAVSRFAAGELLKAGVAASKIAIIPDGVGPVAAADRSSGRVLVLSKNGQGLHLGTAVTSLERDLADCDVLLYWSEMEGLGSAALVAQAAGVPVVAARAGGLPEAIRYGVVIDSLEEAPRAIEQARGIIVDRDAIQREFGISRVAEETAAVYRQVLGC